MYGTVSKPIRVLHVSVDDYLGGSKFSSNTFPGGDYTSDWFTIVSQVITIFAPSGMYTIKANAVVNIAGESMNGSVSCVGLMDL